MFDTLQLPAVVPTFTNRISITSPILTICLPCKSKPHSPVSPEVLQAAACPVCVGSKTVATPIRADRQTEIGSRILRTARLHITVFLSELFCCRGLIPEDSPSARLAVFTNRP